MGFDIVTYPKLIEFCVEFGKPLQERMNRVKHPHHLAKHVKTDIVKVLKVMHSMCLIHGDIKPDNIIQCIREKNNCYDDECEEPNSFYCLIDFGLCRFVWEGQAEKTRTAFFGTFTFAGR